MTNVKRRLRRPSEVVTQAERSVPTVTRVVLTNYKSIESCSVDLEDMTILVGPNGAGKSNFIDGLRLSTDALRSTLEHALRERGGLNEVRRRSRGHPTNFGVRLDLNLGDGLAGYYAFQIAARPRQTWEIQREECVVRDEGETRASFTAKNGVITNNIGDVGNPRVGSTSLVLPTLSGSPFLSRVFKALTSMGFYNLNLASMRELQSPDVGDLLLRDGSNLASVIGRLGDTAPATLVRIEEYLEAVVPNVRGVASRTLGPRETLEFRQRVAGDENPWRFIASSVSDGTLRALGVLAAAFQTGPSGVGVPLVAIEEPEVAIHPGAAMRLMDALFEASRTRQVIITTHSPDLLDHPMVGVRNIRAVEHIEGLTNIGVIESASKAAVRENLYSIGELLRLEQIRPVLFDSQQGSQLKLFS